MSIYRMYCNITMTDIDVTDDTSTMRTIEMDIDSDSVPNPLEFWNFFSPAPFKTGFTLNNDLYN